MTIQTIFERAETDPTVKAHLEDTGLSGREVAREIGVGETAVRKYRQKFGIKKAKKDLNTLAPEEPQVYDLSDVTDAVDLEGENAALRARNKRLYKALQESKNRAVTLKQAVYDAARDASETNPIPTPRPIITKKAKKGPEEVALVHATDWQRGKETESYNSEICDQRVDVFAEKVAELVEVQRADHKVDHGVILFTGDMLEGCRIFPGQEWEVDSTMFDQLFGLTSKMQSFVQDMLGIFKTIDVVCEYGNHGRIGRPSDGWKRSDNFDRIAYKIVQDRMRHETRIKEFKQSGDWYQHHSIGNYDFMAIHGDEIKSFGGNLPSYGIMRKANSWATGVVEPFRDLYLGHYHQSMQLQLANGGSVFMTGSTESHNEFAAEFVAATGNPSQRLNFVHPEKGFVTSESRIWL